MQKEFPTFAKVRHVMMMTEDWTMAIHPLIFLDIHSDQGEPNGSTEEVSAVVLT